MDKDTVDIKLSVRQRWRGFVRGEHGLSIMQTSTSHSRKSQVVRDMHRTYRILDAYFENRVQRFIRKLLKW